jgi:hypothetical protein
LFLLIADKKTGEIRRERKKERSKAQESVNRFLVKVDVKLKIEVNFV